MKIVNWIIRLTLLLLAEGARWHQSLAQIRDSTPSNEANGKNYNDEGSGWRYGHPESCGNYTYRHRLLPLERDHQVLEIDSLKALVSAFQHCGVTVFEELVSTAVVDEFRTRFLAFLEPYLSSRSRVRALITKMQQHNYQQRRPQQQQWQRSMQQHPDDLFSDEHLRVFDEPYLHAHSWLQERHDGRIDVTITEDMLRGDTSTCSDDSSMDCSFSASDRLVSGLHSNLLLLQLLQSLLGAQMELKSIHLVLALPQSLGCSDQHWHRDDSLLFDGDETPPDQQLGSFQLIEAVSTRDHQQHEQQRQQRRFEHQLSPRTGHQYLPQQQQRQKVVDVHARSGGVHLPPYALNVFVPLVNLTALNGATEFTLGSHMWGSLWAEDERAEQQQYGALRDESMRNLSRGAAYIADYRTVHRGTVNLSNEPRSVLMFIYGRKWWKDSTNYEPVKATELPAIFQARLKSDSVCDSSSLSSSSSGIENCKVEERLHSYTTAEYMKAFSVYRSFLWKWQMVLQ